jgi:hypothetical protein
MKIVGNELLFPLSTRGADWRLDRELNCLTIVLYGTRSLLRHCATSRKVAGSIPDGVTGIFH